jgi:RNA recognition motif-containing protein
LARSLGSTPVVDLTTFWHISCCCRRLLLQLLYDTFSAFGVIINTPKLMRDPDTGNSKGFGFVSYDCFEASDAAIEAMNGQYLCNRQITVSYAYKKDTKGELPYMIYILCRTMVGALNLSNGLHAVNVPALACLWLWQAAHRNIKHTSAPHAAAACALQVSATVRLRSGCWLRSAAPTRLRRAGRTRCSQQGPSSSRSTYQKARQAALEVRHTA